MPDSSQPTPAPAKLERQSLLYVGAYAEPGTPSLYRYRLNRAQGALELVDRLDAGPNPSFLALPANGRYLYAVNELSTYRGQPGGAVSAFSIDSLTGQLAFLNQQPSLGSAPCHLALDRLGNFLLVANYESGSLAVYPLEADGRLGAAVQRVQHHGQSVNAERQAGPHAHFVTVAPDNCFALSCDLGLDQVVGYRWEAGLGRLVENGEAALAPGAGPRHLDFHPSGRYVYVINELDSTLVAFAYAAETGRLTKLQTLSTLPENYVGVSSAAEVGVHPTGKFVYGSNRGHDSLVIYTVEAATGRLTLVGFEPCRGAAPRHFVLDPTGTFLLVGNQDSDTIATFQINAETGRLSYLGRVAAPRPVCLKFWPDPNP